MEDIEQLIEELQNRVAQLEAENTKVKQKVRANSQQAYNQVFETLTQALEKADGLEKDFWDTWQGILKDQVAQTFIQIMSPTGNRLGFKFADVIQGAVKDSLTNKVSFQDEDKNGARWQRIVDKIVNNEIVSAVLKSNPVTATVSSVVGAAANFFETRLEPNKERRGLKAIAATSSVFDEDHIADFVKQMQPYIDFYDALTQISIGYERDLDQIQEGARSLKERVKDYDKTLIEKLGFDGTKSRTPQLIALMNFRKSDDEDFDFEAVLQHPGVKEGLAQAQDYTYLQQQVMALHQSYYARYSKFLKDYKACLEDNFGSNSAIKAGFDAGAVDDVIKQIDDVLANLEGEASSRSFVV